MPRHRLGVALLVPPPVAVEVDGLRRALGDGALGRIPPHLTLVPPVNVAVDRLDEALSVLRRAAGATDPLRLRLGPAVTFMPVTPVVYLAVGGDDLGRLRGLRDQVFLPPLERTLTHPFVPHVTLADEMAPARIPAAVAALADYTVDVTVDRLHLLREEPGRVWRPVADVALARPAVIGRGGLPVEITTSERPPPDADHILATATATATASSGSAAATAGSGDPAGPFDSAGGPDGASGAFTVTARRHGEVVGLAQGWLGAPHVRLSCLLVADGARRQGIGRHLLTAVEGLAAGGGAVLVDAVAPDDPACRGLLAGAGWVPSAPAATGWRRWERTLAAVPGPVDPPG